MIQQKLTKMLAILTIFWEYRLGTFHSFLAIARVGIGTATREDLALPTVLVAALENDGVTTGKTHN